MMEQVRLRHVWPTENWLGSSMNHIQGWTTVRESYSRALEQGSLDYRPVFPLQQKLVRLAGIAAGGAGFLGFILGYGGDEKFYSRVVMPTLHRGAIQS